VITLKKIVKSYDGNTVYQDLNLTLKRNDRVALVGSNGAGKTTLLKILAGVLPYNSGERKLGYNVTTAYYAQHQLELLDPENTVLEELQKVAPTESDQQVRSLLGSFLFSGDDVFKKVSVLSGGEKSRLSIAKMLVKPANFLLMDEPTNHLDISSREMLIDALDAYHGTLCFITHDRTVIREIANKIIEIRNGVPLVYTGNYDEYLAWKEKQNISDEIVPEVPVKAVQKGTSPAELQRRRKTAQGELRNNFYKENEPLKKRIGKVEANLAKLESEYRDLETYLATPESYGDITELTAKTRRHEELIKVIKQAAEEWEKLSLEIEEKRQAFEQARLLLENS
jgi:ATP-binding cassette subfamily F protein 3